MEMNEQVRQEYQQKLVTELAEIDFKLQQLGVKAIVKRADELKKEILAIQPPTDPEKELILAGHGVEILFTSAPEVQTINNKAKLKKMIGSEKFTELAQFTVKALEQVLNKEQLASIVEKSWGTRRFKEARRTVETGGEKDVA